MQNACRRACPRRSSPNLKRAAERSCPRRFGLRHRQRQHRHLGAEIGGAFGGEKETGGGRESGSMRGRPTCAGRPTPSTIPTRCRWRRASSSTSEDPTMNAMPRQTSTLAIISLVAGILGWTVVPFFGSIAAVVCGHMARKEIRRARSAGRRRPGDWGPGAGVSVDRDGGARRGGDLPVLRRPGRLARLRQPLTPCTRSARPFLFAFDAERAHGLGLRRWRPPTAPA
jgi:hypothetical protein